MSENITECIIKLHINFRIIKYFNYNIVCIILNNLWLSFYDLIIISATNENVI